MSEFNLIFDPINGHVVPDGKINEWANSLHDCFLGTPIRDLVVGSETMVHELRARHAEGKLKLTELVTFRCNGSTEPGDWIQMRIGKDGNIDHWPNGFCDFTEAALFRLIKIKRS